MIINFYTIDSYMTDFYIKINLILLISNFKIIYYVNNYNKLS